VGNTSRSRASLLYRLLLFLVAILVGLCTYVLVVTIFYTPHDKTKYQQNFDELRAGASKGQVSPPKSPPRRTLCWKYQPSEVNVGEASAIELRLSACDGGDLPSNTTASVIRPNSTNVSLSGPSQTERTPTSQSWAWMASAHTPGDSEVFFLVSGTGLEPTVISENITARGASASPAQSRVAVAFSTASPAVQALAGAVAVVVSAIITTVVPIIANRRSRAKTDEDQAVQPLADHTTNAVDETSNSSDRTHGADDRTAHVQAANAAPTGGEP
jgi:hypothetical protein